MYKVVSVVNRPLVAELSLLLHAMSEEYTGFVFSDDAHSSDNVSVAPKSGFTQALQTAAVAFFPECDESLVPYVHEAMKAGVPIVMFGRCKVMPVEHTKNGMLYLNCVWATKWIREMSTNAVLRNQIISGARESLNR